MWNGTDFIGSDGLPCDTMGIIENERVTRRFVNRTVQSIGIRTVWGNSFIWFFTRTPCENEHRIYVLWFLNLLAKTQIPTNGVGLRSDQRVVSKTDWMNPSERYQCGASLRVCVDSIAAPLKGTDRGPSANRISFCTVVYGRLRRGRPQRLGEWEGRTPARLTGVPWRSPRDLGDV